MRRRWRWRGFVAARVVALLCFSDFDDAFITFRYARNLAEGHGLVYNAGDWVLGTTAPLFAVLASVIVSLGGAPEIWLPWSNIGIDVAIALLVRRLMFQDDRRGFACFVACFALSPMLARVTVGAMEVDLFVLCGLSAFALYRSGRVLLAVALGAVAYFLRPEAVLIVAVLCLAELVLARRLWRALAMGTLALVVVAPGLVTMQLIYGHSPQSVIAKSARIAVPPLTVLQQLLAPEPISAAIAALGLVGAGLALRAGGVARLLLLGCCCISALMRSAGRRSGRGTASCRSASPDFRGLCRKRSTDALVGTGTGTALSRRPLRMGDGRGRDRLFGGTGRSAHPDRITRNIYDPVASFCRANATASDTVLASDIGIIGYRCPGFIEDAARWFGRRPRTTLRFGTLPAATKPTYLFLNVSGSMLERMAQPPFAALYRPLRRFAADGIADPTQARNRSEDWARNHPLSTDWELSASMPMPDPGTDMLDVPTPAKFAPTARAVELSGLGRHPRAVCALYDARGAEDVAAAIAGSATLIARGNGRAYGDPALNPGGTLSLLKNNRFIAFTPATGMLTCEAGVMLADIIDIFCRAAGFRR